MNTYCLFKGQLELAAPFEPTYKGSPHYVINVTADGGNVFKIVVNSASTEVGEDGNNNVYFLADLNFVDPVTQKLSGLALGLHTSDFPRLDYFQDTSLLDLHRLRSVPYRGDDGERADVNDIINDILTIDTTQPPLAIPYDSGKGAPQDRNFYPPKEDKVIVYGFGFLFQPAEDGLHETHMNQGNPPGPHAKENGAFQDGAVIVERAGKFMAMFTAFQTQRLPTNSEGYPEQGALPLPEFIAR